MYIHKYARLVKSKPEKSITNYVIINRQFRKKALDIRVTREAEIYNNNYLKGKIVINFERKRSQNWL